MSLVRVYARVCAHMRARVSVSLVTTSISIVDGILYIWLCVLW
jgi:hypothetical protein